MCTAPETIFRSARHRAFSLLEVVVALAILSAIGGTMLGIVGGTTRSAADIESLQKENRRLRTFLRLCRDTFATLPQGATLELRIVERFPYRQELVIRGDRDAFVFGERPLHETAEVTLAPIARDEPDEPGQLPGRGSAGDEQAGGLGFDLAMSAPDFYIPPDPSDPKQQTHGMIRSEMGNQYVRPDVQGRFWLELLPEIGELKWRFWDPGRKLWLDEQPPGRPPLIELTLLSEGAKTPLRAVFETTS